MSIDRARFEVRCVALCEIIEGPYLIIPAYKKLHLPVQQTVFLKLHFWNKIIQFWNLCLWTYNYRPNFPNDDTIEVSVPQARLYGTACHRTYDRAWTSRVSSINWKHICLGVKSTTAHRDYLLFCAIEISSLAYIRTYWWKFSSPILDIFVRRSVTSNIFQRVSNLKIGSHHSAWKYAAWCK